MPGGAEAFSAMNNSQKIQGHEVRRSLPLDICMNANYLVKVSKQLNVSKFLHIMNFSYRYSTRFPSNHLVNSCLLFI